MSKEITDRDRVAARGRPFTLGGRKVRVRMGLDALAYLEEKYDGLEGYLAKVTPSGWGRGKVRAIVAGMVAGLLHEKAPDQEIEDFEKEVQGALDGSVDGLISWIAVIAAAINEGYPEAPRNPKGSGKEPTLATFPGRSSTTRRPSSSGAPTRRSGA